MVLSLKEVGFTGSNSSPEKQLQLLNVYYRNMHRYEGSQRTLRKTDVLLKDFVR